MRSSIKATLSSLRVIVDMVLPEGSIEDDGSEAIWAFYDHQSHPFPFAQGVQGEPVPMLANKTRHDVHC
jgi:hypothetical protein